MEARVDGRVHAMETRIGDRIDETMRRMQTEILRGMGMA
jgi:hypothetical protein